jgi:hypothetical protein
MAFDNVVAAGSAETLLVFSFFSFIVLFHDSHQKSLLSLYLLPNLSSLPPITTRIVKLFFTTWWKNTHEICHMPWKRKREASAFVRYTRPSIITHPQLWIIKKSTAHFPFKKKTKNSLIVIFIPSAYPTEKEKPKSFFPNIFSWLLVIGIIPLISKLMKLIVKHWGEI